MDKPNSRGVILPLPSTYGALGQARMPEILRVTSITHRDIDHRHNQSTATLFHERLALRVRWTSPRPDHRIKPGSLVSIRWAERHSSDHGAIGIARLVPLERPEAAPNLFETIPSGWVRNRALVREAAELFDELPPAYRHLVNAVLWDGDRFRRFCRSPSSVAHHHSRDNGNFEHSVEVARLMRDLCAKESGARSDFGILIALLHDVGKADEYRLGMEGGWVLTGRGRLIGHDHTRIEWIAGALAKYRTAIPAVQLDEIVHCLSAKANVPVWMGIRKPRMIEATLLSRADRLSAERDRRRSVASNDSRIR